MTHRADASNTLDNRGYSGPLIRGQNPALLIETAVRDRITDSLYWKEQCFGLNAATLLDRAVELTYIGGTYGVGMKPTPFLCLAFKLLTIVPDKEIILEYLNAAGEEWKYVRALAAFYARLAFDSAEVYGTLEPLLEDARKLRRRRKEGYVLVHMDEFIDELLVKERSCATSLWKLPRREVLEDLEQLEVRVSPLQDELDAMDDEDEEMLDADGKSCGDEGSEGGRSVNGDSGSRSRSRSRSRSMSD
jgi:pre-mRNA-splicing factor 38A